MHLVRQGGKMAINERNLVKESKIETAPRAPRCEYGGKDNESK